MAAGLAAEIKDKFGVEARLVEGHDGIYEVLLNQKPVYTNRGSCAGLKSPEEILWLLRGSLEPLPGKKLMQPLNLAGL